MENVDTAAHSYLLTGASQPASDICLATSSALRGLVADGVVSEWKLARWGLTRRSRTGLAHATLRTKCPGPWHLCLLNTLGGSPQSTAPLEGQGSPSLPPLTPYLASSLWTLCSAAQNSFPPQVVSHLASVRMGWLTLSFSFTPNDSRQ